MFFKYLFLTVISLISLFIIYFSSTDHAYVQNFWHDFRRTIVNQANLLK